MRQPRKLTDKGHKARQLTDKERWIAAVVENAYSDKRREVGDGCYASDVDYIEWRKIGSHMVPIAVLEITVRQPRDFPIPDDFFKGITDRYYHTDGQGAFCQTLGFRLGCPVYVVVLQVGLQEYWIHEINYQASTVFTQKSIPEYGHWIRHELEENYRRKQA